MLNVIELYFCIGITTKCFISANFWDKKFAKTFLLDSCIDQLVTINFCAKEYNWHINTIEIYSGCSHCGHYKIAHTDTHLHTIQHLVLMPFYV